MNIEKGSNEEILKNVLLQIRLEDSRIWSSQIYEYEDLADRINRIDPDCLALVEESRGAAFVCELATECGITVNPPE